MASVNDTIRNHVIGHQVDLTRYSNGVVQRMVAILNRADADLVAQLNTALERLDASSFSVERLQMMLASLHNLNLQAYRELERELSAELRQFVAAEADFQYELFQAPVPPQVVLSVEIARVDVEQVYAAAMARPFQGRLLREWAGETEGSIGAQRMARIRDAVRMGYVEGLTTPQIVQRIRGTRAKQYADGLLEIDRRHAEAVVRTAISHTAAFTRDRFHAANADLIKAVQWLSTLDGRTSTGCIIRDRKMYALGTHKPIGHTVPWLGGPGALHWNCRSTSTPVLKSLLELGIPVEDLPAAARESMDGAVPADMTYPQWLARQSAQRQDDVLGATRGALLRSGGLTVDAFYNDKGRFLTLDELRARSPAAFSKAGV